MSRIVSKLNLNKTPQLVENNSLVMAKNIRLLEDGSIGPDTSLQDIQANNFNITVDYVGQIVGLNNKVYIFKESGAVLYNSTVASLIKNNYPNESFVQDEKDISKATFNVDKDNLVLLSPKEHYLVHYYLTKCSKELTFYKMVQAYLFMSRKLISENIIDKADEYEELKNILNKKIGTKILCLDTCEIFNSKREASRKYNLDRKTKTGYYSAYKMFLRDQYMVDQLVGKNSFLIALYDNKSVNSGTHKTIMYAKNCDIRIIYI